MTFQDLLTNPIYLGIGATLGFVVAAVQIYEFLTKGAKVSVVALESKYKSKPIVTVSTERDGQKTTKYSGSVVLKIQLQNSGTELTSITSTNLVLPNGNAIRSKVSELTNFSRGPQVSYLVSDDRTIVLESGIAIIEIFEFEIEIDESDYVKSSPLYLKLQFVNHSEVNVVVSLLPSE